MSYTLFTDKPTLFECKLELDGASLKETIARIIIEGPHSTLLFPGIIGSTGVCEINIDKMRGMMDETTTGMMKLEVIADGTYFQPWTSDFVVNTFKRLTVEVKESQPFKPLLKMEPITPLSKVSTSIVRVLKSRGISINDIKTHRVEVKSCIMEHIEKHKFNGPHHDVIDSVIKLLSA